MLLGRYEVIRKIGVGGFGEVLLARAIGAEGFERVVAVKRLKGDLARKQGSLQGIINEARIGGMLNHPNIVQVLEFIQLGPDYLLIMEYVDGIGLQELLDLDRGPNRLLTPGLALDIVIQVCEGLHYAHSARGHGGKPLKLIHRDIKPSNLMLTRTGTVKIMDFGVARSATNLGQSTTGSIKGTLRYLSPEQAEGSKEIGHASDIFSLGLVLSEMVLGHPVYEADQEHLVLLRALQARTGDALREAEVVAPGLGPILTRCLAPNPDDRYRTAEEFAQALRALKMWFPVEYGLPALVDRLQAERRRTLSEEESTETSFSLELRRKGLDKQRRGWEMLVGEDEIPTKKHQPPTPQIPDLIDEAPMEPREVLEAVSQAPPSRTWEWEWHISDGAAARSELDDPNAPDLSFPGADPLDEEPIPAPSAQTDRRTGPTLPAGKNAVQARRADRRAESGALLEPQAEAPVRPMETSSPASEAGRRPDSAQNLPGSRDTAAAAADARLDPGQAERREPRRAPTVEPRLPDTVEMERPPAPAPRTDGASMPTDARTPARSEPSPPRPAVLPVQASPLERSPLAPAESAFLPMREAREAASREAMRAAESPATSLLPLTSAAAQDAPARSSHVGPRWSLGQFLAGLALGVILLALGFLLGLEYVARSAPSRQTMPQTADSGHSALAR